MPVVIGTNGKLVYQRSIRLADIVQNDSVTSYSGSLWLSGMTADYAEIYKRQLWVFTVVNKLAFGTARLPLKVYRREEKGRPEASDHPYARLLRNPSPGMDPVLFWLWTASTFFVFGEALWRKDRDGAGIVKSLSPIHPATIEVERDGERLRYRTIRNKQEIPAADIVHFRSYNPDGFTRGLSPLEPLRQTLLNEDASRRATAAFWAKGARPAMALRHPGKLSKEAQTRLRESFGAIHAGADNTGETAILEEGMEAQFLSLNAEEAQYIETRKLNREEVCGAYDVPPPVVHILDRATYSNITEQMRSMYRDTMAPKLRAFEAVLETQLRPDFGDGVYAEFLMDEVLRGAFETRTEAYQKAINSGWMTPAEVREAENLPFVDGSDQLFINSAAVPIAQAGQMVASETVRTVLGRIGRVQALEEIDRDLLTLGLNGDSETVTKTLELSTDIEDFRKRVKALGGTNG